MNLTTAYIEIQTYFEITIAWRNIRDAMSEFLFTSYRQKYPFHGIGRKKASGNAGGPKSREETPKKCVVIPAHPKQTVLTRPNMERHPRKVK